MKTCKKQLLINLKLKQIADRKVVKDKQLSEEAELYWQGKIDRTQEAIEAIGKICRNCEGVWKR